MKRQKKPQKQPALRFFHSLRANRGHRGRSYGYLVHPDVPEEIDKREADSLTSNIIGVAIDVHRALELGLLEHSSNENINPSLCSLRALW